MQRFKMGKKVKFPILTQLVSSDAMLMQKKKSFTGDKQPLPSCLHSAWEPLHSDGVSQKCYFFTFNPNIDTLQTFVLYIILSKQSSSYVSWRPFLNWMNPALLNAIYSSSLICTAQKSTCISTISICWTTKM